MGGSGMANRVEGLEKRLGGFQEQLNVMDSKFGTLVQMVERGDSKFSTLIQMVEKGDQRLNTFTSEMKSYPAKEGSIKAQEPGVQSPGETDENLGAAGTQESPVAFAETETPPKLEKPELESGGGRDEWRRRLELPVFSEEDAIGWLARAERYFHINGLEEKERIDAAWMCFEGAALGFKRLRHSFTSWAELRREILKRFGPMSSPQEELISLRQSGTVAEFRGKFEWLSAAAQATDEGWLRAVFMAGLSPEIQAELRVFGPNTLDQMMQLAQAIEARNMTHPFFMGPQRFHVSGMVGPITVKTSQSSMGSITSSLVGSDDHSAPSSVIGSPELMASGANPSTNTLAGSRGKGYRRLTTDEYQARIDKGLCLRCDEKHAPGHRCQSKQLKVLLVHPGEEDVDDGIEEGGEDRDLEGNQLMKIFGEIQGKKVVILVASGATHTFMHPRVAEQLTLPVRARRFVVALSDGKKVSGEGVCPNVEIDMEGAKFVQDCFLFDVGDVDIMLGFDWLCSLGEVEENWKTPPVMSFEWEGEKVRLQGDPALMKKEVSMRSLVLVEVEEDEGDSCGW